MHALYRSYYWIVDFFFSIILHIGDYVISRNELYDVELCVPGHVVLWATRSGTQLNIVQAVAGGDESKETV